MKYKIITSDINGVEYISGCILMSESDQAGVDPSYLIDTPVTVADENGLLQYAIINGNIVHKPQEYSIEQLNKKEIATLRQQRDFLINSVEWRVRRFQDELALGLEPTEDIIPILEYIQALRDVPQQENFPHDVVWPKLEEN